MMSTGNDSNTVTWPDLWTQHTALTTVELATDAETA